MEKAPKHDIPAVVRLTSICLEDHRARSPSMVPTDVRPATLTEPISVVIEPMNHTTGAEPDEPSVSRTGRGRSGRLGLGKLKES